MLLKHMIWQILHNTSFTHFLVTSHSLYIPKHQVPYFNQSNGSFHSHKPEPLISGSFLKRSQCIMQLNKLSLLRKPSLMQCKSIDGVNGWAVLYRGGYPLWCAARCCGLQERSTVIPCTYCVIDQGLQISWRLNGQQRGDTTGQMHRSNAKVNKASDTSRNSSSKNDSSVITYSPSCHSKTIELSAEYESEIFEECFLCSFLLNYNKWEVKLSSFRKRLLKVPYVYHTIADCKRLLKLNLLFTEKVDIQSQCIIGVIRRFSQNKNQNSV